MTGEVTLQGRVLPIGGVKQKVLAAQRAGLTVVVLPARNGPDLDDVPEAVREGSPSTSWITSPKSLRSRSVVTKSTLKARRKLPDLLGSLNIRIGCSACRKGN